MSTVVVTLIFWTRFAQKRLLRSKTEKVIELIKVLNFSLNLQFQIFGLIYLPNKYALYIFVIHQTICCISFTNRTNIATKNPKLRKYYLFTDYVQKQRKIRKLWVNPKKSGRRKLAIPIRFTKPEKSSANPAIIYLFQVNNRKFRKMC